MNVFAKFDEIPSMILQDIKETKRYGHTHTRKDGQLENSGGGGGYKKERMKKKTSSPKGNDRSPESQKVIKVF